MEYIQLLLAVGCAVGAFLIPPVRKTELVPDFNAYIIQVIEEYERTNP